MRSRLTVAELLEDERVRMLVNTARHACTSLTFDVSAVTKRACAENLARALDAFDVPESDGLDAMPPAKGGQP